MFGSSSLIQKMIVELVELLIKILITYIVKIIQEILYIFCKISRTTIIYCSD